MFLAADIQQCVPTKPNDSDRISARFENQTNPTENIRYTLPIIYLGINGKLNGPQ